MRILFLFMMVPVFALGQTIHIKEDKIVYEGKEKLASTASFTFSRILQVLPGLVNHYEVVEQSGNSVKARGDLQLKTPYPLIRKVIYSIKLSTIDNGYEYQIDSIYFTEQERGEKIITRSSKEMVDGMKETGAVVGETEKILNETDMRFQKLLALLRSKIGTD